MLHNWIPAPDIAAYQNHSLSTELLQLSANSIMKNSTQQRLPRSERRVSEIDWNAWVPVDRATLLFVIQQGEQQEEQRILLIEKKRGLGAGKVNGPGGRIDANERPIDAAVRELREELCVGATNVVEYGELSFQFSPSEQFVDGYLLHCHVFRADAVIGVPTETDEAAPLWAPLDKIPFDRMWADDALWLPLLLAKKKFRGRFIFDGDTMVDHEIQSDS